MAINANYDELVSLLRTAALLGSCNSVLGWDEQTYMPIGGGEHRADQLGLIAGLAHEKKTLPRIGELLAQLEAELPKGDESADVAANVREARRNYDRATKLPQRLVEEISRTTSLAQQAWVQAKKDSDFPVFEPWLDKMLTLKREEAAAVGYGDGVPYDALLDEYEPGATAAQVAAVFAPLRDALVVLVQKITQSERKPNVEILERHYPKTAQRVFSEAAARAIGFDFDRGRIDESAHPFCSGFGPGDCRLTTRVHDHHFNSCFFGVLHEAGHGIYEQGLPTDQFGLGLGSACSLGVHESQSRLWENGVGRSRAFWQYFFKPAQQAFPEALKGVTLDEFHFAINDVRPSYIRVEADEVTYNLHIMLRFEIEQLLMAGDVKAAEVPALWNEKFQQYFQMAPRNDAEGCLQDIHWSAGLLGYFPTYALGNMYAAQLYAAAERDLGDLSSQFAKGEFKPLKKWLNEKIHAHGQRYTAQELIERVTGEKLSSERLVNHLNEKYGTLYGLS